MKAIVINKCCKAEDLRVTEIPMPTAKPGWVVVKIHAAGLNHPEAILRMHEADNDYINTPIVPGIECVGEIADAGDSHFTEGDKVIALMGGMGRSLNGSYAEYALQPIKNVFKVDTNLDWVSLAAIPETYFTAYGSLIECLLLTKGDTLLVRGATSTVGQAAIQLAKAMGATVVAAARRESLRLISLRLSEPTIVSLTMNISVNNSSPSAQIKSWNSSDQRPSATPCLPSADRAMCAARAS